MVVGWIRKVGAPNSRDDALQGRDFPHLLVVESTLSHSMVSNAALSVRILSQHEARSQALRAALQATTEVPPCFLHRSAVAHWWLQAPETIPSSKNTDKHLAQWQTMNKRQDNKYGRMEAESLITAQKDTMSDLMPLICIWIHVQSACCQIPDFSVAVMAELIVIKCCRMPRRAACVLMFQIIVSAAQLPHPRTCWPALQACCNSDRLPTQRPARRSALAMPL